MALESKKNKALSKSDIVSKAVELDLRRQEQIRRQTRIIDRLLTENQILSGLVGELSAHEGNLVGYRDKAKEALAEVQRLRAAQREEDEKMENKDV